MASEESNITKDGMLLCEMHPIVKRIYRTQSGMIKKGKGWMHLCPLGTPDTTGFTKDGRHIGIEYKTEEAWHSKNHGASDDQLSHLCDIYEAGGLAGIACNNKHVHRILEGEPVGLEDYVKSRIKKC